MASKILNFDVDDYLNPVVPSNQLKHLPRSLSRWFGYRPQGHEEPPALVCQLFAFIGTLGGLLTIGAIYKYSPGISQYNPPVIIASLGASAILEYNSILTPLSQPRSAILGHAICAVIGVAISKAFQGYSNFEDIKWVSAALACALGCLATGLTGTIHPPGGATAVLASVEPKVLAMGWSFVPVIIVGACVMLAVGLINNNILRQFPVYWWSPSETGTVYKKNKQDDEENGDKQTESEKEAKDEKDGGEDHDDETSSDATLHHVDSHTKTGGIFVSSDRLILPADIYFSVEESNVLRQLQTKLKNHGKYVPLH